MNERTTSAPASARNTDAARGKLLYLSRDDVARCDVTLDEIEQEALEGFRAKGRDRIESPPKRGVIPRPDASIRAMMAFVPGRRTAGCKWISAFPENVRRGLPTIAGVIALNNVETGLLKAIMDASWITAMRTAAASLVAARHLARRDSGSLGLIGCGVEGRTQLEALCARFPIRTVRAYDLVPEHAARLADEMASRLGVAIETVPTAVEAVREADIVVSSAPIRKRPSPAVTEGVVEEGAWFCALDFDATIDGAAMSEMDRIVVDDDEQLRFFRSIGYFRRTPRPDTELPAIVTGSAEGRTDNRERILSLHLGIGFLDIMAAELVYRRALSRGLGTWLES